MSPNRPARLNRTVLALLGLLLLLAGALVLIAGSGVTTSAPAGLPVAADAPLLPPNPEPPAWLPWAGTAAAAVVGLAALRWLAAQAVRVPRGTNWQLADDPHTGATLLSTTTAAAALAAGSPPARTPRRDCPGSVGVVVADLQSRCRGHRCRRGWRGGCAVTALKSRVADSASWRVSICGYSPARLRR